MIVGKIVKEAIVLVIGVAMVLGIVAAFAAVLGTAVSFITGDFSGRWYVVSFIVVLLNYVIFAFRMKRSTRKTPGRT
ncbi:MAG: hypothetical protein J5I90_06530 [Caldilineales bacterium]|nr:hypothetical protein [Caldilineales bacterium]